MIGGSDAALIMRAAMSDGTLLSPDVPATKMDAGFVFDAFGSGGFDGEVWSTHADVAGIRYSYVLAINVQAQYNVTAEALGYSPTTELAFFEANSTDAPRMLPATGIAVRQCGKSDFQAYTVAPVLPNGWTLLGEPDKWVSVSRQRFGDLAYSGSSASVVITGMEGETVHVAWLPPKASKPQTVACVIPRGSAAVVTVPLGTCELM